MGQTSHAKFIRLGDSVYHDGKADPYCDLLIYFNCLSNNNIP